MGWMSCSTPSEQIDRQHGALSIQALSDHIGISQNHLGTQFKRMVGVPPKELARFYRFAHVVSRLTPQSRWIGDGSCTNPASMIYPISNKDFVEFTGHSPTDYLRLRRRFHDENPEQLIPWMLAHCQLIEFLQVIRVILLHDEK